MQVRFQARWAVSVQRAQPRVNPLVYFGRMITEADRQYMQLAIERSEANMKKPYGGPFGAVIVKDGKVLAAEGNAVTHPKFPDPTAHAEVQAIRKAALAQLAAGVPNPFNLAGSVLYTSCEPCAMCYGAAKWANIDHIFYGNTSEDAERVAGFAKDTSIFRDMTLPIEQRSLPGTRLMPQASLRAFEIWRDRPDKVVY